jgi:hypothetical protein
LTAVGGIHVCIERSGDDSDESKTHTFRVLIASSCQVKRVQLGREFVLCLKTYHQREGRYFFLRNQVEEKRKCARDHGEEVEIGLPWLIESVMMAKKRKKQGRESLL